jgi:hypothetical protein
MLLRLQRRLRAPPFIGSCFAGSLITRSLQGVIRQMVRQRIAIILGQVV